MSNDEKILHILQQIQVDVNHMKTDITNMKTDITNMKTDITNMKTDIEVMKTDIKNLNARQDVLEKKIDVIYEQTASLAEFRTETNEKFENLTAQVNTIEAITKENLYDITKLKLAQ